MDNLTWEVVVCADCVDLQQEEMNFKPKIKVMVSVRLLETGINLCLVQGCDSDYLLHIGAVLSGL